MELPADWDDDALPNLAPPDPATDRARKQMREGEPSARFTPEALEPKPVRWQFTLRQLILANTVLAVILALLQVVSPGLTAGVFGMAALALLLFVMSYQPDRPELYAVAWVSIVLYLVVAGIAMFN